MTTSPSLRDFYDRTFAPHWLQAAPANQLVQFCQVIDTFCTFKPNAIVDDLDEATLNEFAEWAVQTKRAQRKHGQTRGHHRPPTVRLLSQLRQIRRFYAMRLQSAPHDMKLMDFLLQVYVKECENTPETIKTYRAAVRGLENYFGAPVMLSELSRELLDKWRAHAGESRYRHVGAVEGIWRFAFQLGYVSHSPDAEPEEEPVKTLVHGGDELRVLMTNRYFPAKMSIREENTRRQYRIAVDDFERYLERVATLTDLTDEQIVGFMRHMEARGLAAKTINERAGRIKTLWRFLASKGYLRLFPTADRMPEPAKTPSAWTLDELTRLFQACREMPGQIGPIRASDWWTALHGVLWNTGERISACMAIEWSMIDRSTGQLVIPAEKRKGKRKDGVFMLWPDTLEMLDQIDLPERDLVFPFPFSYPSTLSHKYRRLLERAGLPVTRDNGPHKMRRSHASWLKAAGGNPTAALGHSSGYTTERSYLDPRIGLQAPQLFKPWKPDDDEAEEDAA